MTTQGACRNVSSTVRARVNTVPAQMAVMGKHTRTKNPFGFVIFVIVVIVVVILSLQDIEAVAQRLCILPPPSIEFRLQLTHFDSQQRSRLEPEVDRRRE